MNNFLKKLWNDEEGIGTLEILLIIAVLVAIAVVFRKQIIKWVNAIFTETDKELQDINQLPPIGPDQNPNP